MFTRLFYVHDPMCSWCWAFRPIRNELPARLPEGMSMTSLVGGLAPDSDDPMPVEMQEKLQSTWARIQTKVPGTEFNFDFWTKCKPRRSTYPACRAVIAARTLASELEDAMVLAIQHAYYLEARNPSDDEVLIQLAGEIGLDKGVFRNVFLSDECRQQLLTEIDSTRRMGASSFPSLILQADGSYWPISVNYNSLDSILQNINDVLSVCR